MIANGLNYHVDIIGDNEPLVLLHGFTGSAANWAVISPAFRDSYTVVTLDLPGHGCTDSPADVARYSMANVAADLISIFDQLGFPAVNLLGYSMGGRLALYLAVHHPKRLKRLILESSSPGLANMEERQIRVSSDESLADRIECTGIDDFVDFWEKLPLWESQKRLPDDVRVELHAQRLQNNPCGLANSLRGMGTGIQPSLWEGLSRVKTPTLLLAGALDSKFVHIAQRMHITLPDSQLLVIPDAGHTIHLEQPHAFSSAVAGFLKI